MAAFITTAAAAADADPVLLNADTLLFQVMKDAERKF